MTFADTLQRRIEMTKSFLCAGLDPVLESFPSFILKDAEIAAPTTDDYIYEAITNFYRITLDALAPHLAAVKPNFAFYEQYGFGGLRALATVIRMARDHGIPVINDAKRGDIGNTSEAYARACLSGITVRGERIAPLAGDAMTVSPYLGFDTLDPFVKICEAEGKGIFILVKTSNPRSGDIQNIPAGAGTVATVVADYVAQNAHRLRGECGLSGLGAVVGAPYPDEAKLLRTKMPDSFFLMPGVGAQGGTIHDAKAGFIPGEPLRGGAVVNASRGLFSVANAADSAAFAAGVVERVRVITAER